MAEGCASGQKLQQLQAPILLQENIRLYSMRFPETIYLLSKLYHLQPKLPGLRANGMLTPEEDYSRL